jgi:D-alanine-D-alanine ligase
MRVAVLANLKHNAPHWEGMSADQWDDLDSEKTINGIIGALESEGHKAKFFEASVLSPYNLIDRLAAYKPDICFNIAESHFGDGREAQIPALLEMLRIPYTGSQVLTLALALDKPMTKRILAYHGLPTPEFQVFERADEPICADLADEEGNLRFPLFLKPSREGTSMGVSIESIVQSVDQLRERVGRMLTRYNEPILCEHYISGREVMVGMLGNIRPTEARRLNERFFDEILPDTLTFLPILEFDPTLHADTEADLYTNRLKTDLADDYRYHCPAQLDPALEHRLKLLAGAVFRVIGCKDVARVDIRIDHETGQPYILEINPLPGLNPGFSDLCLQTDAAGLPYERLINTILENATARYGLVVVSH